MPSNCNFVCIKCRISRRGEWSQICHHCRQQMRCIGKHWRVPKKNDDKGWKQIKDRCLNSHVFQDGKKYCVKNKDGKRIWKE